MPLRGDVGDQILTLYFPPTPRRSLHGRPEELVQFRNGVGLEEAINRVIDLAREDRSIWGGSRCRIICCSRFGGSCASATGPLDGHMRKSLTMLCLATFAHDYPILLDLRRCTIGSTTRSDCIFALHQVRASLVSCLGITHASRLGVGNHTANCERLKSREAPERKMGA